jgi:hypothetical protein
VTSQNLSLSLSTRYSYSHLTSIDFTFVPVRHQLNVVLLTSVVWTALLSAWYPPEEEVAETIVMEEKKD